MFGKAQTSSTHQTTNYRCIITHNSEAQINASERDRATRGSQKIKKQKTVTPTIKGNATAVRSQNTKYYILRHGLSPRRHGFVLPANIRGTHAPPWLYHLPRPWPARSHEQARTRTGGAVTSRPTTAHAHPPKRCRPSYPLKSMQKATRRRAMITARITDHRISARAKHRSHRRSRVAHDIHIDKPIAPHNARRRASLSARSRLSTRSPSRHYGSPKRPRKRTFALGVLPRELTFSIGRAVTAR